MRRSLPALIENTDSMGPLEKGYWLELLPYMTKIQVGRLWGILQTEKDALDELEKKYGALPMYHYEDGSGILYDLEVSN